MINCLAEYDAAMHALYEYPKESVGVVIDGKYQSLENVSESPMNEFGVRVGKDGNFLKNIDALIHSHPHGDPAPSARDMQSQASMAVPWGIVPVFQEGVQTGEITWFGDQYGMAPLVGRKFLHGARDCYSLVRDWYWEELKITLPVYPRSVGWQDRKEDLLSENEFTRHWFQRVYHEELERGDIILFRIHSQINNHCGVYIGDHLLLHHLYNRLSKRDPIQPWLKLAESCWRPSEQTKKYFAGSERNRT